MSITGHSAGSPVAFVESDGEDRPCDQQDEGPENDEPVIAPVERRELERNDKWREERHKRMIF